MRRAIEITAAAIWLVVLVVATSWLSITIWEHRHPTFHCQGKVGVYESRDGSQIVPQVFDPNCVDPSLYNGG